MEAPAVAAAVRQFEVNAEATNKIVPCLAKTGALQNAETMNVCTADETVLIPQAAIALREDVAITNAIMAAAMECFPPALPILLACDASQCLADLADANPAASQLALSAAMAAAMAVRSAAYKALAGIVVATSDAHFYKAEAAMVLPAAVHPTARDIPTHLIPAAFAWTLVTANFGFAFNMARESASDVSNCVADVSADNDKILNLATNGSTHDHDSEMEHVRFVRASAVPVSMYNALCDIVVESSIPKSVKTSYTSSVPGGKPSAGTNTAAMALALRNAEFQTAFDLASNIAWDIGKCVARDIAAPKDCDMPVGFAADYLTASAKDAALAAASVAASAVTLARASALATDIREVLVLAAGDRAFALPQRIDVAQTLATAAQFVRGVNYATRKASALADEIAALAAAVDATAASVNLVIPAANTVGEHVEDAVADVEILMPAVEQMHGSAEEHLASLTLAAASAVATAVLEALVLAEAAAFAAAKDKLLSPAAAGEGHVAGHKTLAVAIAAAFSVAVRDAACKSFALADALTKSLAVEDTVAEIEFSIKHVEGEPADVLPRHEESAPWHKGEYTEVMAKFMKLAGSSQNSWLISEERRHVMSRMPLGELRRRRFVGPSPPFKPRRRRM